MKDSNFKKSVPLKFFLGLLFASIVVVTLVMVCLGKTGDMDFGFGDFSTKFPVQKSKSIF